MSEDQKPPHIRLAVQNNQSELNRRSAEMDLRWVLKRMAANAIRVVRGAGRPEELGLQCAAVVKSYQDYHNASGEWPSPNLISNILSIRHRDYRSETDRAWEWEDAVRQMVAGGLQIAASQLMEQNTQERAGVSEMFDGLRVIERQRRENAAAYAPKAPKSTKSAKPRPKPKNDGGK